MLHTISVDGVVVWCGGVMIDGFSSAGTAIRGWVVTTHNLRGRVGVGGGNKMRKIALGLDRRSEGAQMKEIMSNCFVGFGFVAGIGISGIGR